MDLRLAGRVALITGGASGLGHATARYMLREGVRLVLADRDEGALERAIAGFEAPGDSIEPVAMDVRRFADCERAVGAAIRRFGQLDILVNSAGIGGSIQFFAESEPEDWTGLLEINLLGVMHCCRAVTDHMIARRYGKIVSLASEAGKANERRMVVYGTTKGGVISLTRGLAAELGRYSINVNAVCPGVTHTPMTSYITPEFEAAAVKFYPLGRLGRPDDIAPLVTFLASDEASWITGQAISVSGGFGRS